MNFWESFTDQCRKTGYSAFSVLSELNLSKGNAHRWKQGSPSLKTAKRIADYLHVAVDDLVPLGYGEDVEAGSGGKSSAGNI